MEQPHFVLAVLLVRGRYALQLRDDKPDICAPNVWGLFGGRVEDGENAALAIAREVEEELCIRADSFRFFWETDNFNPMLAAVAHYTVFEAEVTAQWAQHRLTEGQRAEHFAFEELAPLAMPPLIREILARHHAKMMLQSPQPGA
jgi:8-oxo-dGTP pyrophosphatase MutT (NUDIX family)